MDWVEIGKWVASIILALGVGGLVFKFAFTSTNKKSFFMRFVSQKGNTAGRDIIAGDSIKKTEK
ncbi:MAG TPA: hypothetical protein VMV75_03335 [Sulfuricella sp.]|nr:hypothetical protein [Sulfuricella sp.]